MESFEKMITEITHTIRWDQGLYERLVEEGKRIGKAPWCCCSFHEAEAFKELRYYIYWENLSTRSLTRKLDREESVSSKKRVDGETLTSGKIRRDEQKHK